MLTTKKNLKIFMIKKVFLIPLIILLGSTCCKKESQIPSPIVPVNTTQQVFTDAISRCYYLVIPAGWFMAIRFYV